MLENGQEETVQVSDTELSLVGDIFKTLIKTVKTFSVYPKENPVYQKFANDIFQKFDTFFQSHETLNFDIEQYSMRYKGHEVFHSEERTSNIALLLFIDGIRQLSFHRGLTFEEVIGFIETLRDAPKEENAEDDIVTLLWEKDYEHVGYFVPEEAGGDELAIEESIFAGSDSTTTGTSGSGSGGGGSADLSITPQYLGLPRVSPSDNELNLLRQKTLLLGGESILLSALQVIFELMASEKDISNFAEYSRSIEKALDLMMEKNNPDKFMQLLKKLNSFYRSLSIPEMKHAINRIISKAGSTENIKSFSKGDHHVFNEYLLLLNKDAIPGIIELLGEAEDRRMRRLLCNALSKFVKLDRGPFAKAIRDERWFLVRNIVTILGLSREPSGIELIKKILKHSDLRVRKAAVLALESIPSEETKKPLMILLNDPDPHIRVSALKALRRFGGRDLLARIMEHVLNEDFKERDFQEKREFLEAMGETGKEDALGILKRIFNKKSFFKREKNLQMRACAAYGLGYVGMPEAVSLLEKGANSKKRLLSDACRKALKTKLQNQGENDGKT